MNMDEWMDGWMAAMRTKLKLFIVIYTKVNQCGFVEPTSRIEREQKVTLKVIDSLISNGICSTESICLVIWPAD